ncbi:toxic anion resistance protein [Arthrobacter gengyunqii]|uniref:Toxic anion resistance protein n=1 Tax=Arthrobacter gengyunqii TaxID=2886940 RepID=A0A9X1M4R0_9MICC|nr:toxic anion resistance protein [Arthrobacter gengyunqii]MCC3270860.1 toxic anion resistance protein [Arthrobacter gengyunqii]UOY96449.1 toxic anion resistance protein [Arthrobacter gengyunqii]
MSNPLDLSNAQYAEVESPLVLEPPKPVVEVVVHEPEKVGGMVLVDAEAQKKHAATAKSFLDDLLATPLQSPDFQTKLAQLIRLGEGTMQQASTASNRMLKRPAAALAATGDDPASRTGKTLVELRQIVTELDPKRHDLTGKKRILRFLPGGDAIQRYFMKYESAQAQLDAITKALKGGQDDLRQDNAAIQTERDALWEAMGHLANYAVLANHLGDGLEQRISDLRNQGKTDEAGTLEADALFYVRQRHQDLLTQMAVSIQGYLALDVVRKNNSELIKGVDRALGTTLAALRVAVIVAQALAQQKIVLAQIDALNSTTADMIVSTSELLRSQGTAIHQNASKATLDPAKLQQAFDNVFQAMDEVDRYRAEAAQSMKQTVQVLQGQVSRAQLQLERSHSSDASATQTLKG